MFDAKQIRPRGPQLVVRAYEILKSEEYNEDFRISNEISRFLLGFQDCTSTYWDFLITGKSFARFQANFARFLDFRQKNLIACDF